MRSIRISRTDGHELHIPVDEKDDGPLLAERIAKQVNNAKFSGADRLIELTHGKYVLASMVRQVWFATTPVRLPRDPEGA